MNKSEVNKSIWMKKKAKHTQDVWQYNNKTKLNEQFENSKR